MLLRQEPTGPELDGSGCGGWGVERVVFGSNLGWKGAEVQRTQPAHGLGPAGAVGVGVLLSCCLGLPDPRSLAMV